MNKNIVIVTEKGKILCEVIEGNLLSSPALTAKWEAALIEIGEGKGAADAFLERIKAFLTELLEVASQKMKAATNETL